MVLLWRKCCLVVMETLGRGPQGWAWGLREHSSEERTSKWGCEQHLGLARGRWRGGRENSTYMA